MSFNEKLEQLQLVAQSNLDRVAEETLNEIKSKIVFK